MTDDWQQPVHDEHLTVELDPDRMRAMNWHQPSKEAIMIMGDVAYMAEETFGELVDSTGTFPHQDVIGMMWKARNNDNTWWLCWYKDGPYAASMTVKYLRIEVVKTS